MRLFIQILFFCAISFSAYARVYCPEIVECTNNTCHFDQESQSYWSHLTNLCDPRGVRDGVYENTYVSAPYSISQGGYAICVYTHEQVYETLMLRANHSSHLIILEDEWTQWRAEESWGECRPKEREFCPLQVED